MQGQIEEMEMQIGKAEGVDGKPSMIDFWGLAIRIIELEKRVKELESRFNKHVHFSGYFSGNPE